MLDGEEIKQILYTVIEDRGREKIQAEITSSIELSQKYIDIITRNCISPIVLAHCHTLRYRLITP